MDDRSYNSAVDHLIKQYALEPGALEIQYIEEYFGEFPRRKTAAEIINRLQDRESLILMAEAPLPSDPGSLVPVSYKVDRKSTRLNSSHIQKSRMPSYA